MTPTRVLRAAAVGLGFGLIACVSQDRAAMQNAREAYDLCVTVQGSRAACESQQARYLAAQRRYEQNSRSAWGCNPAQEECPIQR